MVIPIQKEYIKRVVEIDMAGRKGEFLTKLGIGFLNLLYSTLINMRGVFAYVFKEADEIGGFIIGVLDTKQLFIKVILRNGWKMALCLVPVIIKNPYIIKYISETFFYPIREGRIPISAELLVMGVDEKFRRMGIGNQLVCRLNEVFKGAEISEYKVTVTKDNEMANQFYMRLGFQYNYSFRQYDKEWNLYIYKL